MPINILLVSDSASDRQKIIKTLNEYSVLTAANEEEALRVLEEHENIYLMLLDLDIPDLDGIQLLKSLKASNTHDNLFTIIMSERNECGRTVEGLELGIVDYCQKPLDLELLQAKVSTRAEVFIYQDHIEEQAQNRLRVFETIFKRVPLGVAISLDKDSDLGGAYTEFKYNPEYIRICGRPKKELQRLGWHAITHPDDLVEEAELFRKLQSGETDSYSMDKRIIMPDGSCKWVHIISITLHLSGTSSYHYAALLKDIDEEKRANNMLREGERSKSLLLSNLNGMAFRCRYDRDWTMEFVSSGCHELCGCSPESLQDNTDFSFNELIAPEHREHLWKEWKLALDNKTQFRNEYEIIDVNGVRKWVLEIGEGVFDEYGQVEALEGIIIDISDRKEIEKKLRYVSEHDDRTGLYNLYYFEQILRKDQRSGETRKSALVGINLNSMYSLSLKYGILYTRKLIKKIADVLLKFSSKQRVIFSSASYRFIYYVKDYEDKSELLDFCKQITSVLHSLLDVERVSFGIGIYEIADGKKCDTEEMLKNLLRASEEAFALSYGDSSIYFYDDKLEQRIHRRNIIQQELGLVAEGEEEDRIFLQFQPIINLSDNRISEFEALARFDSKELGLLPPLEFIPIAEETKDIIPIGKLILRKACRFLKKIQSQGHDEINISINVSAVQILSQDFVESTIAILSELALDPENIHLELTESVFTEEYNQINAVFGQLSDQGIKISLDDFGTAYSSFARLRELKVDTIKIDRPFIAKINDLREDITITNDIISMAHKMELSVVAEGVETEKQFDYLKLYGCDKVQGYLISKPMDEDVALKFVEDWDKTALH